MNMPIPATGSKPKPPRLDPTNPDHVQAARELLEIAGTTVPEPAPDPASLVQVVLAPWQEVTRGLLITDDNVAAVRAQVGGRRHSKNSLHLHETCFYIDTAGGESEANIGDVVVQLPEGRGFEVVYREDIGTLWRMEKP